MNQVGVANSAHSKWSLSESIAKLNYGQLSGEIDLTRPTLGLSVRSLSAKSTLCTLLGACRSAESMAIEEAHREGDQAWWPLPVADRYVRGRDLVAAYQPVDRWPYSPQLYWRAGLLDDVAGVLASLSLLVSVQTHLLDTHPQITVTSSAPSVELLKAVVQEDGRAESQPLESAEYELATGETTCIINRLASAPVSFIELASSRDFHVVRGRTNGNQRSAMTEWRLFSEFLEKGVIRKACVHGALVPQKDDLEIAIECCRATKNCPLPLTT